MKPELDRAAIQREAAIFAKHQSSMDVPQLFGVTDGKAIGTYLEHSFQAYLRERYHFEEGNAAKGIDFPTINRPLSEVYNKD